MTQTQIKTLFLLLRKPGTGPRDVAEYLWPDSNMHTKSSNSGTNGSCRGKAAWLCAGSYMAKLSRLDFASVKYERDHVVYYTRNGWQSDRAQGTSYYLTKKGYEALEVAALELCDFCQRITLKTTAIKDDIGLEEHIWGHALDCKWALELKIIDRKREERAAS